MDGQDHVGLENLYHIPDVENSGDKIDVESQCYIEIAKRLCFSPSQRTSALVRADNTEVRRWLSQ